MDVKLMEEVCATLSALEIRPEDFGITINEYSKEKHTTNEQARTVLEKAVRDGLLNKKRMIVGAAVANVYYRKTSENLGS